MVFVTHVRTAVAASHAGEGQDQHRAVNEDLMHPGVDQFADIDVESGLLEYLAANALLRRLARFEPSSGELPLVSLVAKYHDAVCQRHDAFDGNRPSWPAHVARPACVARTSICARDTPRVSQVVELPRNAGSWPLRAAHVVRDRR